MSEGAAPDAIAGAEAVEPRRTRRVLSGALIVLNQSFQSLSYGGIALFLPLIRKDLGLSFTEAGSLGAASMLVYAFMQIPAGYLADRVGPKRLFVIGLVGANVLAFSLAFLHRYWEMLLNQAATGVFRALVFAPGLLLLAALFPLHRRATAIGLYVAGGFSGNVLLNSVGPLLVGPIGWRLLFVIFAGGGLAVLFLYSRFGPEAPSGSGSQGIPIRQAVRLFRHRVMWVIGAIQYIRLSVFLGVSFWLPTFIVVDRGYSLKVAGAVVAIGAALTAPSNFLGGYVADRSGSPLAVIGGSLGVLALTTFLIVHVHNLPLLIAVVAVNAFFVQLYFGPLFAVPITMLGAETAGLTSGFGNFFANIGGFTFAYTLGVVRQATGSFELGFYCLGSLCVVGVLCTILLARMRPIEAI